MKNNDLNEILESADKLVIKNELFEAEKLYHQVLYDNPGEIRATKGVITILFKQSYFQRAIEYWEPLPSGNDLWTDINILIMIGNCYRKVRNFEKAIASFEKAFSIDKTNPEPIKELADSYRGIKGYKLAKKYYLEYLENEPNNISILTRTGDVSMHLGEIDDAEKYYKMALDIEENMFALIGMAKIELLKNNTLKAMEMFSYIEKKFPKHKERIKQEK